MSDAYQRARIVRRSSSVQFTTTYSFDRLDSSLSIRNSWHRSKRVSSRARSRDQCQMLCASTDG